MVDFFQRSATSDNFKFSILIPTWNNLEYLKICINSIQKNSYFKHQIVVHVNEGLDGTKDWLETQNIDYSYSHENIGICWGMNAAYSLAKTDIIVYFNDDMYACPDWDLHIDREIEQIGHPYFFISSTMIEPRGDGSNACVIAPQNFGDNYQNFNEVELLEKYKSFEKGDWYGASWPPSILHRKVWNLIGGYSVEFSPGMYSDPDIAMKLWLAGVRIYKGIGASRVYHFMTKSTVRLKNKKNGRKIFIKKWGISAREFSHLYLKRGNVFNGPLQEPKKYSGLQKILHKLKLV
jgi:glycosyltransferase involved in cell wall biosynthesis